MGLKLWSSPHSYNSLRAHMVLAEKGITDFEELPADLMRGTHKTPEFRAKSPFGQVPVLEEGDLAIFESRAIARYLARKYADKGPRLIPDPADAKATAVFDKWSAAEVEEFNSQAEPFFLMSLIHPAIGVPVEEKVKDHFARKLNRNLDVLEGILGKQKYMLGSGTGVDDEFSLVDISYMPGMYMLSHCADFDVFTGRDNLKRWWVDVSGREAWKKIIQPTDEGYLHLIKGWTELAQA